jgi:hypothetical protein
VWRWDNCCTDLPAAASETVATLIVWLVGPCFAVLLTATLPFVFSFVADFAVAGAVALMFSCRLGSSQKNVEGPSPADAGGMYCTKDCDLELSSQNWSTPHKHNATKTPCLLYKTLTIYQFTHVTTLPVVSKPPRSIGNARHKPTKPTTTATRQRRLVPSRSPCNHGPKS